MVQANAKSRAAPFRLEGERAVAVPMQCTAAGVATAREPGPVMQSEHGLQHTAQGHQTMTATYPQ